MHATPIAETRIVHRETVPGARYWSMVIKRGFTLRLTDVDGRANAALLAYNPHNPLERYNMADTLKGQHVSRLTRGNMLFSDMGRAMFSITEDSVGWHDPIGGISDAGLIRSRYGIASFQDHWNDFYRDGRELFLIELAKWGLGPRDLTIPVNFFQKVSVDDDGDLHYHADHSHPGASVDLRAEADSLVVLATAPHPMAPGPDYRPGPVAVSIFRSAPVTDDDFCIHHAPENARAYANTLIASCQE
ncbi:urea amidolyase associated protein UAAP1 [uncultured Thiohalocapsa sp.]|uniref:urea amidolyase associated protein UAAP1 n=1 Tax=uncultured Thiohalocapsa sp. TaxID=768990 RepID=UPI0025F4EA92|nr:urea amidolyase associated protein UAAP1 [uncultured Thiohalocapsa sp.]